MATSDNDKPRDPIKDSAQQIWLAGLGAFAKMQQEGSKAFEALVKDGVGLQKKTQQAAEETLSEAQTRMAGLASELGAKASGGWGKLENIFEERVARALKHLSVPSAADMTALQARIESLEAQLKASKPVTTAPSRKSPTRPSAAKATEAAAKPSRRRNPPAGKP